MIDQTRKHLSATSLLTTVKACFSKITVSRLRVKRTENPIKLSDCLMSALAIFGLKIPSLLKFDTEHRHNPAKLHNIKKLYQVEQIPSDTYMRERLDEVDPKDVRKTFKNIFSKVQRGNVLESFKYLNGSYLMPMDGTGFFASNKVHCENCCKKDTQKCHIKIDDSFFGCAEQLKKNTYWLVKKSQTCAWQLFFIDREKEIHEIEIDDVLNLKAELSLERSIKFSRKIKKDIISIIKEYHLNTFGDSVSYYHNMLCSAIVHPDIKTVIPFAPEPILNTDGSTKNDCEHNASKRFIADFRREHPHLEVIAVQDSLASNFPNLNMLKEANISFITGAKPGDHKTLFKLVNEANCSEYSHTTEDGTIHKYRYLNSVSLNKAHENFKINFLEYWSESKKEVKRHFSWVTDITIEDDNCYDIMRGGRSNWKIENNTFNTLKNQGYHFEHNFGHGDKYLSTVFGMLMVLAFFIDQVQEQSCNLWKKARDKHTSRSGLFDRIRSMVMEHFINSWDDIYKAIGYGHSGSVLVPNTS